MAAGIVTAIDIGSETLKVVALRRRKSVVEVLGAGMASLAEVERDAPDYALQVGRVLHRTLKRHSLPVGRVVAGLGGRPTMIRYLSVPMVPPWKLKLLMGFEVEEQIGNLGAGAVAHDYRILTLPDFEEGQFPVFLALGQLPAIVERLGVCRAAGLEADDVALQGLGAFHLFRRSAQCREGELSVLLDVGAEETHLTLQQGPSLWYARTLSSGGRRFTQRIEQEMEVLPLEAEELKRLNTRVVRKDDEPGLSEEARKLSEACGAEVAGLASGVESSLQFFRRQLKVAAARPARLVLTGGGARLGGLAEALGRRLGVPAETLDVGGSLRTRGRAAEAALSGEEAHQFAGAVGLALGVLPDGVNVSLLPPEVKDRRDFWRRRVYVAYAGVAAALVLLFSVLYAWRAHAAAAERNAAWTTRLERAAARHEALDALVAQNAAWGERVGALAERAEAGRDLLETLRRLAETTPPEIFFVSMETVPDFLETREVLVTGYVAPPPVPANGAAGTTAPPRGGPTTVQEATDRITALADTLQAMEAFEAVDFVRQKPLPATATELVDRYRLRLWPGGEATAMDWAPPLEGEALVFALRIRIR